MASFVVIESDSRQLTINTTAIQTVAPPLEWTYKTLGEDNCLVVSRVEIPDKRYRVAFKVGGQLDHGFAEADALFDAGVPLPSLQ